MDISAALAVDLAALTQALDDPGIDLETELKALAVDVQRTVTSYCAMTITIALEGQEVSFAVHDDSMAAGGSSTSLLIPLAAVTCGDTTGTLVLYAANPGAFVDLAADVSHALGIDPTTMILDAHLPAPVDGDARPGLDRRVVINQAIGILMGRGHTPESASDELQRLANLDHGDLRGAATLLLSGRGHPPDDQN